MFTISPISWWGVRPFLGYNSSITQVDTPLGRSFEYYSYLLLRPDEGIHSHTNSCLSALRSVSVLHSVLERVVSVNYTFSEKASKREALEMVDGCVLYLTECLNEIFSSAPLFTCIPHTGKENMTKAEST